MSLDDNPPKYPFSGMKAAIDWWFTQSFDGVDHIERTSDNGGFIHRTSDATMRDVLQHIADLTAAHFSSDNMAT